MAVGPRATRWTLTVAGLVMALLAGPGLSAAPAATATAPRVLPRTGTAPAHVEAPGVALMSGPLVHGQPRRVGVHGTPNAIVDVYAVTLPDREFRLIATVVLDELRLGEFTLPGITGTTRLYVQDRERGLRSQPLTLTVRRAVTLAVTPAGTVNRFSGRVDPPQGGLPVTLARVGVDGRLTGLLGTMTDSAGTYSLTAAVDDEHGPLTVLTAAAGGIAGGRSRDVGRPWPRVPAVSLRVARDAAGAYRFTGTVTPGRSVPVTLARLVDGRRVGVAGGRSDATGAYAITRRLPPGLHVFQVVTGWVPELSWGLSRQYGLRVP